MSGDEPSKRAHDLAAKYLAPGVAAGDTVAVRYVIEATHEGNLPGLAPTGRPVRWDAADIYRLAGGMIVEEWTADDATAILYQVGAYTPPWLATSRPTDADGAG